MTNLRYYDAFEPRKWLGRPAASSGRGRVLSRGPEKPARPSPVKNGSRPIRVTPPPPDHGNYEQYNAARSRRNDSHDSRAFPIGLALTHQRDGPPFCAAVARPNGARASDDGSEGMVDETHARGHGAEIIKIEIARKCTRLHGSTRVCSIYHLPKRDRK